ncbi:MAG TPA: hypothetical protein VLJ18_08250 [Thermoanaerobaculia bacterium]|nr:hypothetical protein [Thermoanaerobaculia bacterium]
MRHQILTALLLAAGVANASSPSGFGVEVLVDGRERPEYVARGTVYVEALRGRDYAVRLSNPTGTRVAVALSVDGLNTIDSRRTTARDARKWVLAPYETVIIPGWQVSNASSRKFFFTGERGSYGAALGKTQDLGVIEAVFFRERLPYRVQRWWKEGKSQERISSSERGREGAAGEDQRRSEGKDEERISSNEEIGAPLAAPPLTLAEASPRDPSKKRFSSDGAAGEGQLAQNEPSGIARDHSQKSLLSSPSPSSKLSDEYAATGMGRHTQFGVTRVDLELETEPAAVVRLRYEFRPQLIALGVLPRDPDPSRIARREHARGFEEFCPEVK